uniref:Protein-PII uridylyltransferase N-terminal domain-containing protein n=1 Tax=Branchiostoma floridae TaxID=7739 RepID=C3Z2K1_BRAFL|eukprot:XP_002597240.1 hypothetical protein BRAFLDRAFT_66364 [Branchiostoma floridae]
MDVSSQDPGRQEVQTNMSTVVEEFRELDMLLETGCDLDVAERGYAGKLIHAISSDNKVMKCEALKSLGDLFLQKAKSGERKEENFNKACSLYKKVLGFYGCKEDRKVIQHRIKYAEKCTKLKHVHKEPGVEISSNTTLVVSALSSLSLREGAKMKEHDLMPLIEGYTNSFVNALVDRNRTIEIKSLKKLGDLHLEKGMIDLDEAAFSKSAGLYQAAMGRCEDSDCREILKRCIKNAKEVKEMGAKPQLVQDPAWTENSLDDISRSSPSEEEAVIGPNSQQKGRSRILLRMGSEDLQEGDLDKAERDFAAALKFVSRKGNWEETEPLCKLSDVYLKRGIQSKDGGDFTKAAALCNAALVRAKMGDQQVIKQTIQEITQLFVEHVLNIDGRIDVNKVDRHKLLLKENRDYVEEEIKRIEQQADPYSLDDDDPNMIEAEKTRAETIKRLFDTIASQRRTFTAGLVDECITVMGPPPCKYAMIGLGSQATGLVTPYSDLEFAILVEEETENILAYFRNLTHYLHIKVINLGETILPSMGIKSLNDFCSDDPLDNWFYDSVTPRGFSFDGAMPNACKTPLGRGKSSTSRSELIRTPRNMTGLLEEDLTLHLNKGYHLASVLGNVCFITGERDLVESYVNLWTQQIRHSNGQIPLSIVKATLTENASMLEPILSDTLLNVKKEIYRFSSLAVSCWALLNDIYPTTIWETIANMYQNGVINEENAHHLQVMVSISAELRLRTYMNNGGQVENMSALSSQIPDVDTDFEEKLKKVFYFSNRNQLMRYYFTAIPLKNFLSQVAENNQQHTEQPSSLFDKSPMLEAEVYRSLGNYRKAKTFSEQALQDAYSEYGENSVDPIAYLIHDLAIACQRLGEHQTAVSYLEQSLQMMKTIHGEGSAHPDIARLLHQLGVAMNRVGDNTKAISYIEQSQEMWVNFYGENIPPLDFAHSLNSLGNVWDDLGYHRKALRYFEQSLHVKRCIYGEETAHAGIAESLMNVGFTYNNLGNHREAISYHLQSLFMRKYIYGENTVHPHIAESLSNLAVSLRDFGDYNKSVNYHEQSLQMKRTIYGKDATHADIANSLLNLGGTLMDLGDYSNALRYCEQSFQMWSSIYGNAHPHIAVSLNNLGNVWRHLGDHRKAIDFHEKSLEMRRFIYGEDNPHYDTISSLFNLGGALNDIGNYKEAVSCLDKSLQMSRRFYGQSVDNRLVASVLNKLGDAWKGLGDRGKAESYQEQAQQMIRRINYRSSMEELGIPILPDLFPKYGEVPGKIDTLW